MAAQRERTIGLACHRNHAEVQRRRGPAIQANLGLTRDTPQRNRREIDVIEMNRAFKLLDPVAGQPHDADVRVDALD